MLNQALKMNLTLYWIFW